MQMTLFRGSVRRKAAALIMTATTFFPALYAQTPSGAVYTMSNQTSGNRILIFNRAADGRLTSAGSVATGGTGNADGLGNQGGLIMSQDERWLFAVNSISNDISTLAITASGLELVSRTPSGGRLPVSLTVFGRILFVLNADTDNLTGFEVADDGRLLAIPGSTYPLSGAGTGGAQVQFSRDGQLLVVTERLTNRILVWQVEGQGRLRRRAIHNSAGQTPFGFVFGERNQLFVSEAFEGTSGASVMSSYQLTGNGGLQVISPRVSAGQSAACWVAIHPDEPWVFASNTGSNSISTFRAGFDGTLTLQSAVAATTDANPFDVAVTPSGRFLYSLNFSAGTIGGYTIGANGALTPLPGTVTGIPVGANGLVAR